MLEFDREGLRRVSDGRGRQLESEGADFVIVERLAVARKFEPADDKARRFEFLEMQMQQRSADADLARQPTDIVASTGGKRRDDPEPVRVGESREDLEQMISSFIGSTGHGQFFHM